MILGKILVRIILHRFTEHIGEVFLPKNHCGFRKGGGATDIIFAARHAVRSEVKTGQHADFCFCVCGS